MKIFTFTNVFWGVAMLCSFYEIIAHGQMTEKALLWNIMAWVIVIAEKVEA